MSKEPFLWTRNQLLATIKLAMGTIYAARNNAKNAASIFI
jgi:hypothetical protein